MKEVIRTGLTGLYHFGGPVPVSLYGAGMYVLKQGGYEPGLLNGISRFEEKNGPPRIGNVALDSSRLAALLNFEISKPITGLDFA